LESEIASELKNMEGLLHRAEIRRRACVWMGTELRRGTRNGVETGLQVLHAERVLSRAPYTRFPPHMILPYRSVAPVLQERDIELDQPLDWSEVGLDAAARTQLWAEWAGRFLPANQRNILPIAELCRVEGAAPLNSAKKAYDLLRGKMNLAASKAETLRYYVQFLLARNGEEVPALLTHEILRHGAGLRTAAGDPVRLRASAEDKFKTFVRTQFRVHAIPDTVPLPELGEPRE
jgi:hypothetical protein